MKMMRVLDGEAVWPPPVWLMRQAGRYLPEYRATRAQAGDFLKLCLNPPLAAEVTFQPIRRYGFDAAILFSDILILPMALGQGLRFAEGEGPRLPPLADLDGLRPERAAAGYAPVLETVRLLRAGLDGDVCLIGFCGAPLTVACYMLDGQGGGFPRTKAMAAAGDPLLDRLVDLLVDASVAYLRGQVEAGADCVMLFDTWAGLAEGEAFDRYVIAPQRRMVAALKQFRPGLKVIGFPKQAGARLGDYVRGTGVDAVGLGQDVVPAEAIAACPVGTVLQGNLDPVVLLEGGERLVAETRRVTEAFRGVPHIFNLGHGITPDVNPDHVSVMLNVLRKG
jgi:uroporphyrinogen decarboxylase